MLSKSILKQASQTSRLLVTQPAMMFSGGLNQFYVPNKPELAKFTPKNNKAKGMASNHRAGEWSLEEI